MTQKQDIVVIKKYANRRLYDTSQSKYVTLEDLCEMVKRDEEFVVQDAKTGEDLTRAVITQIIFEQESKGYSLLPLNFLKHVIRFYDDSVGAILPSYLESMMDNFAQNQDKMRAYVGKLDEFSPYKQFEELGKKNMEFFENMMSMYQSFNPISAFGDEGEGEEKNSPDSTKKD